MLVSPKNKFIFFKSMKTAGSSIEMVLLNYCGENALCAGSQISTADKSFEYPPRNNKDHLDRVKFHAHTWPGLFKSKIKNYNIFEDYKKVSVVRNPWDQIVSYYWYAMNSKSENIDFKNTLIKKSDSKRKAQIKFEKWFSKVGLYNSYMENDLHHYCPPSEYIGGINEKFIDEEIDYYIIFEDLNKSFREVAKKIIPEFGDESLPRLKTGNRKLKKHYSWYYNSYTRKKAEKYFVKTINKFNYKFENKK